MIRSPSGDIDIISLFLYHDMYIDADVFIDNGTGNQRKVLGISSSDLSVDKRNAIIGLHSFSGNDYVSCFFRKGKVTCWKKMCMRDEFITAHSTLGVGYQISDDVMNTIEKYVCALYGRVKLAKVNEARSSIFWDKYNKDKKIVDLCMLPPCLSNLKLHIVRSNYVAYIFRHASDLQLNLEPASLHGWNGTEVQWAEEYFPSNIQSVLVIANENVEEEESNEDDVAGEGDDLDVELQDFS